MRQLLILIACLPIAASCLAQVRPVQTKPATTNTNVIKNVAINGADLSVTITGITYKEGNYTINYTLRNNGNVTVDLQNVTMQGNIYDANGKYISPGGGVVLKYDGVLNAGQEFKGRLGCTDKDVYKNWNYKYVLKADETNAIAEVNENNNTAEYPIVGYKDAMANVSVATPERPQKISPVTPPVQTSPPPVAPPPAKPLPDLVITSGSITKKPDNTFEVQYTMKNIGAADLEIGINGIRSNGRIPDGNISKCNTYHFSNFPGKVLKPGETYINIYSIAPNLIAMLNSGQQYEYWITIDYIKDIKESNENNNDFKINFRPIF
ncbi:MAG: hypothetical protein ABS85_06045 [Sphingobacteriales bacterium SCN 48-20]|uniref:CARDB domain-containing protein n=1 Tax=Terrimonas ferruginea TaxID=249 RepID=UPI00086A4441|nr:CARDB domain-containing protein [Terrimonas ferruginea]MBN8783259.1 hypothetical protein [Terrimonas ferruginea]ODT93297.1 MAG: hypothetical protein ABS85_06045 [Sphingobacteriales bacterium SCN 48-20]OJW39874.1 MAG: hypothetical protein BGO56_03155 [Sphingobacteriales bacterium 48-107]